MSRIEFGIPNSARTSVSCFGERLQAIRKFPRAQLAVHANICTLSVYLNNDATLAWRRLLGGHTPVKRAVAPFMPAP